MPHCSVVEFHFQLETEEMADVLVDILVNGRAGEMSPFGYIVTQKNSGIFSQILEH